MGEKGAQWLVTLARLGCTSATSVPLFSHPERYLIGPFSGRSKWDQSGVKIDPHCAKQFKIAQNGSNPVKIGPQAAGWVGTNSPTLA